MSDSAARAQRLDAALAIWDSVRVGFAHSSPEVVAFLDAASDEDVALWTACAELESDLRRRGWDALERIAALMNDPERDGARDMLDGLTREQAVDVIRAARDLGWLGTPPSEDD
jgi:hypothetical protein